MMSSARDRTARSRIREYLAQHGPIEDPSGRATSLLKDAVGYQGSSVAFIQLVTAMDKAEEIAREIRGKRTYRISVAASESLTGSAGTRTLSTDSDGSRVAIDYDELARAVLRELSRAAAAADLVVYGDARRGEDLDAVRLERDRLLAERDEYVRRLQVARGQLSSLLRTSLPDDGIAADGERTPIEKAS